MQQQVAPRQKRLTARKARPDEGAWLQASDGESQLPELEEPKAPQRQAAAYEGAAGPA
jgi:hypothetical protein